MSEVTLNILYIVMLGVYLIFYISGTTKQDKTLIGISLMPLIVAFILAIVLNSIFNFIMLIFIFACAFKAFLITD